MLNFIFASQSLLMKCIIISATQMFILKSYCYLCKATIALKNALRLKSQSGLETPMETIVSDQWHYYMRRAFCPPRLLAHTLLCNSNGGKSATICKVRYFSPSNFYEGPDMTITKPSIAVLLGWTQLSQSPSENLNQSLSFSFYGCFQIPE